MFAILPGCMANRWKWTIWKRIVFVEVSWYISSFVNFPSHLRYDLSFYFDKEEHFETTKTVSAKKWRGKGQARENMYNIGSRLTAHCRALAVFLRTWWRCQIFRNFDYCFRINLVLSGSLVTVPNLAPLRMERFFSPSIWGSRCRVKGLICVFKDAGSHITINETKRQNPFHNIIYDPWSIT